MFALRQRANLNQLAQNQRSKPRSRTISRTSSITLFVYVTAPSQEAWARVEKLSVTPRWNEFMKEVLETDEKGDLIVLELDRAFTFGDLP